MSRESELSYVAGFIDGEGCFYIGPNGGVTVSIVNTSLPVLEYIRDTMGLGKIIPRKQRANKNQFNYRAYGDDALTLMGALLPFLIEKKEQAELILNYRSTPRGRRIASKKGLHKDLNREQVRAQLTEMKRKEYVIERSVN